MGFIISDEGIKMDPAKIRTIVDWKLPADVTDVKSFTGFAGFY